MKGAPRKPRVRKGAASIPEWGTGKLLHECYRAFITKMQALFGPYEISVSEWHHLRALWEGDGISQVALSRRIGIQKASSTAVLDKLEARGFIRRVRDPRDRRNGILHLTPEGRAMIDDLIATLIEMNVLARRGIPKSEIATCLSTLERMTDNIRNARTEKGEGKLRTNWRFPVP
jgi:MarR family transcriptional regulator for hemolysin